MGNEKKKRNKVGLCESDSFDDCHLGLGDLSHPLVKKKKTKHTRPNKDLIQAENSFDIKQKESLSELGLSENQCEHSKVKKTKKRHLAIEAIKNSSMPRSRHNSENQSDMDLHVTKNTSCLAESENIESGHAHERGGDLVQDRKKKKRKHIGNSIQAESSNDLKTSTTELTEPSSSLKKRKKHKSLAIDLNESSVGDIPSDQTGCNDVLGADSRMNDGKLSKANILDLKGDRKSLPEQNQCDNLLFKFKDDLPPSKGEKSITGQFNTDSSNKKLGGLLNPTYLQNKNIENSSKFIKQNADKRFSEAKLLKKEELKSRYPEVQDDTIELSDGRHYTISIAIPASILEETCLLHELRTYVIGQLARAACIFSVDEIIVYNDQCWRSSAKIQECIGNYIGMMKMILEYQECPQYLRRDLFPRHPCMSKVGVLNALNAPHHLLSNQWCTYREGIVIDKNQGKVSFVDVGLRNDVQIDRKLDPGLRVTVKFPPEVKGLKKLYGSVVSPHEPRIKGGLYWGYTVRVANSLPEVFKSEEFQDGYDLIIGTSDKGDNIYETELESFKHALVVFGGVDGLEMAMEADATVKEKDPRNLFQYYLNCCPNQQSRTIRTEEAVFITLSSLSQTLKQYGSKKPS